MKFHATEPIEAFQVTRYVSETQRWEIAVNLTVLGGQRIHVRSLAHDPYYVPIDYCCGESRLFIAIALGAVRRIFEGLDESATIAEVVALMPQHTVEQGRMLRPIGTDRPLWDRLMQLAGIEPERARILWDRACGIGRPAAEVAYG